jgi:hypothetical protein
MATRRTTFGKLERERQKREKAAAKRERRASMQEADEDDETTTPVTDEGAVLDALAELHTRYDNGEMELEEFEVRRDELRAKLTV